VFTAARGNRIGFQYAGHADGGAGRSAAEAIDVEQRRRSGNVRACLKEDLRLREAGAGREAAEKKPVVAPGGQAPAPVGVKGERPRRRAETRVCY